MTSIPRRREDWWLGRLAWTVVPIVVRVVGGPVWRLRIDPGDGFPDPPFVIAANHFSFLDSFLIAAAHRTKIRYLALVDLFGNYGWVDVGLTAFDVIPVRRGVVPLGAVREALHHLEGGGVVGLFPEGTRHHEFDPGRARPGAAWLAARAGVPLVPVAVTGSDRVLGVDNRLHRGRVRVTVGPALFAQASDRAAVDELTLRWGRWIANTLDQTGGGDRRW